MISSIYKDNHLYLNYFGFNEPPFSITPDPEFLFFSNTHKNVIDSILYGINNRMGFIMLVGEVGTGKTTLCRLIIDNLENKAELVYIINPSLSGKELIASILEDLGIDVPYNSLKKDLINLLNNFLINKAIDKPVVIIIDDAQTVPIDTLEDLRLLSNLETDKFKLLQMILVGQPELLNMLNKTEMRQLKQRVAISCHLNYLTKEEIDGYIQRRLFVGGNKGNVHFTHKAVSKIYKQSNGIPRIINKICDYALIAGYLSNSFVINALHVKKALIELGYKNQVSKKFNKKLVGIFIVLIIAILLSICMLIYSKNNITIKKNYIEKKNFADKQKINIPSKIKGVEITFIPYPFGIKNELNK